MLLRLVRSSLCTQPACTAGVDVQQGHTQMARIQQLLDDKGCNCGAPPGESAHARTEACTQPMSHARGNSAMKCPEGHPRQEQTKPSCDILGRGTSVGDTPHQPHRPATSCVTRHPPSSTLTLATLMLPHTTLDHCTLHHRTLHHSHTPLPHTTQFPPSHTTHPCKPHRVPPPHRRPTRPPASFTAAPNRPHKLHQRLAPPQALTTPNVQRPRARAPE